VLLSGVVTLMPDARAQDGGQPFSEAELFFELNDTDGDLGLHASIDGEPWKALEIEGPNGRLVLEISGRGELAGQGLTQLAFESAEPSFEDMEPMDFLRRFPEGRYEIEGSTVEPPVHESSVVLSHVMAAPPENILVNRVPAAKNCDAPLPTVIAPVLIDWDPVTRSHPTVGKQGPVTISRYQFFVEREGVKLSLDLPSTVTQFEIPRAVTDLGNEFKFEIIARTSTGNNTAIESCFRLP
jgi:hypothetical protein